MTMSADEAAMLSRSKLHRLAMETTNPRSSETASTRSRSKLHRLAMETSAPSDLVISESGGRDRSSIGWRWRQERPEVVQRATRYVAIEAPSAGDGDERRVVE